MIKAVECAALSVALEKLKEIIAKREKSGKKSVIFCEDRLTLAAERTVCAAVEGTFNTSVYTFARFLSAEKGNAEGMLSPQGSAMAISRIINEQREKLTLFKKLSSPSSAQSVYDTIALLYASRVSAEQTAAAAVGTKMLGGKLHDLAIIYSEYEKYLKESGRTDRNGYLRQLGEVVENSEKIKGAAVIFLGFQAFTCTALECVRAAFSAAESVFGLFIGGREDFYVNEALPAFCGAAEEFGGAKCERAEDKISGEAQALRGGLFNPECFYKEKTPTLKVGIYSAADGEQELEFIAASIKKHVLDGDKRYAKISVMLPDLEQSERALSRVFKRFKIPYYADRRRELGEHSLCGFVINYSLCALYGCRPEDVDGVVASPYFPAEEQTKDVFRNYALRLANFRGGVKRAPDGEVLKTCGFDFEAVEKVRSLFLKGLACFGASGVKCDIFGGIRGVLKLFDVENTLKELAEKFEDEQPVAAKFGSRALEAVLEVIDEAESLSSGVKGAEIIKILKSGFSAMKISLIPPKADAVFVGDLTATANTGSDVVFAARLTGDVPGASDDTSLLTDREIAALEEINLNISPKIRQVNARKRETAALNLCAFRERLYLSFPVRSGGEECGESEIISYVQAVFCMPSGENLKATDLKRVERSVRSAPYYCSEKLPALKRLKQLNSPAETASVYEVLRRSGFERQAEAAMQNREKRDILRGEQLFLGGYGTISPTALETYFACPYLSFMRQGLKVREREEGAVRAPDTGNFIHSVLQDLAGEADGLENTEKARARAREIAEQKLKTAPYSAMQLSESGKYTAEELVEESVKIAAGMFEQIEKSSFKVSKTESTCEMNLGAAKIYGRIDRVDECGDMVRIIDYKTGTIDASPVKYYTGAKLQLPLYLKAVSAGKRAAGAYYFPAAITFRDKEDGVFRLQGFMDGSDEVVSASDSGILPRTKSGFVDAYLGGKKIDSAMTGEDFENFLDYSVLVAGQGVKEMTSGYIAPSPAADTCKYCKAGGSCGFSLREGAERKSGAVKCSQIAALVKNLKGAGNE